MIQKNVFVKYIETTDTDPFQTAEIPDSQMACITYLNSFSAPNALEILKQSPEHEVVRIAGDAPIEKSFEILSHAHAYQCVGARGVTFEQLLEQVGHCFCAYTTHFSNAGFV